MKKLVIVLLTSGMAVSTMAAEGDVKAVDAKDCPAVCKEATALTCADKASNKVQFKVSNVGCEESCSELTKTIAGLQGVKSQAVCAKEQTAVIEIEPGKTCAKTLNAALIKAGYKVEGQQVSLKVKGMTCGGCSSGLSKALTSVKGVVKNEVCHQSGVAQVLFDPEKVDTKQLTAVIVKEGYTVEQ